MVHKELYKANQIKTAKSAINQASGKYTPDLNIPLPIEKYFEAVGRTIPFFSDLKKEVPDLLRHMGYLSGRNSLPSATAKLVILGDLINKLSDKLGAIPNKGTKVIPFEEFGALASDAKRITRELIDIFYAADTTDPTDLTDSKLNFETHISDTRTIHNALGRIDNFCSSHIATAANNPNLLLFGEAGTGKTHLLCSIAEKRIEQGLPTFLFLADQITTQNPWDSILASVGFKGKLTTFLKSFNQYAKNKNTRALIIIDAINETTIKVNWNKLLNLEKYDSLGVILSVRSGFEKMCVTAKMNELLVPVEHQGYVTVEWEAVSKYFTEYGIPMPEVPLLLPDFTNPLFLTIFCKTYKHKKEPIKGHAGFTTIFEDYVKTQGDALLKALGEQHGRVKGNHKIWDGVMKEIAQHMSSRSTERISDYLAKKIVRKYFPNQDASTVLLALERQFLLLKIPTYRKSKSGIAYKFPYQKFSDHLIVRYLLNDHLHKGNAFHKNQPLGKILTRYSWSNYGLVEALAIQIPERLKGKDLIDIAPKAFKKTPLAKQTLLHSLIWRKIVIKKDQYVTINSSRITDYFNEHINDTHFNELLNTLLTISTVPNHPFNVDFLHRFLLKQDMPKRDALWIPYISENYADEQDSSVERIIFWAWKRSKQYPLSKESVRLCSMILVWFLGSSHRYIRDRSTKALVTLLENNIDVLIDVFKAFDGINDLYIQERIFAVGYGCVLRSSDPDSVGKLAEHIYSTYFESNKLPVHLLLRDYARGIIETGKIKNPHLNIPDNKINPPYHSVWNEAIPTLEELKEKYNKDENGSRRPYSSIWFSLMYNNGGAISDFGNYVVNSTLGHWTNVRIGTERALDREEAEKCFEGMLSQDQIRAWLALEIAKGETIFILPTFNDGASGSELKSRFDKKNEKIIQLEKDFITTLSDEQKKFYHEVIEPVENGTFRDSIRLDNAAIQRKIFSKVIELGWKPELFDKFDKSIGYYGREPKKEERIGKKYQWIAFHVVLAEIADNFIMRSSYISDQFIDYSGPWQVSERDIDPSCILDSLPKLPRYNNAFTTYDDWKPSLTHLEWGQSTDDFPISKKTGFYTDANKNKWCILKGFFGWEQPPIPGEDKYDTSKRSIGLTIQTYLVPKKNAAQLYKWFSKQSYITDWTPESGTLRDCFLREFPKHFAYIQEMDSDNTGYIELYNPENESESHEGIRTNIGYASGYSGFDCSHDEGFNLYLPSQKLCELLKIHHSPIDGIFTDGSKNIVVDSGVSGERAQALLADYNAVLSMLKENDLELFWIILGNKRVLGGNFAYGRQIHVNCIMRMDSNGKITLNTFTEQD